MELKATIAGLTEGSYRHALFYKHPGGLRFELSEGGCPLDVVLTALNKATVIGEDVFAGSDTILVHLQQFVDTTALELRTTLRALATAGVHIPETRDFWTERNQGDDADDFGDGYWVNCAFEAPVAKLQNLLWCALVRDFDSLQPNPCCWVYLVNPAKGMVVHPYDDRGMDVIGRKTAPLQALYDRHGRWLLAYDSEAMDAVFKRGPGQG